jgi:hypothetical protein
LLLIFVLFFFQQTQRPEQSVMQALESLNDSQVNIYIYTVFLYFFKCSLVENLEKN